MISYRIKDVARINARALPENTDLEFRFRYIDIGAVSGLGSLSIPDGEVTFATAPSRARRLAPAGSVIISTVRTYLRAIAAVPVSDEPLVFSTGFAVLEAEEAADDRYLAYHCRSQPFVDEVVARSIGVSYPAINPGEIGSLPITLPSLEEQRRIADFLDVETAHIDQILATRQTQTQALEDRELALIAEMLSGGVTVRSGQPTGWPWLPAIPHGWKIGPVYGYFFADLGKMLNAERATGPNQRPYLRNANVHWYEIDTDDMLTMDFSVDEIRRYAVQPGDLLVCEGGAGVAEAAVWGGRISECYYQKSLHRVRRAGAVPVEWLMYWLRLAKHVGLFESEGNLATIPHLTGEQLRQYRIPIPTNGDALVQSAKASIEHLGMLRARLNDANDLLAERRRALITAAVTGQLDVTTACGGESQ